jgi:hypothetical protein
MVLKLAYLDVFDSILVKTKTIVTTSCRLIVVVDSLADKTGPVYELYRHCF